MTKLIPYGEYTATQAQQKLAKQSEIVGIWILGIR